MPKQRKVLKVFISQPMHGRSEEAILKERQDILSLLGLYNPYKKTWDIHLIYNYCNKWPFSFDSEREKRVYNIGTSICFMSDADLVVYAPGYETASGCLIESYVCDFYGIPNVYIEDKAKVVCEMKRVMRKKGEKNGKETKD